MQNLTIKPVIMLICIVATSISLIAQVSDKHKTPLYYRLTLGGGLGKGFPLQETGEVGIGGTIEFAVQKKNNVYALGVTGISEFDLLSGSNVHNSVSSWGITYGKAIQQKSFFSSISGGLSLVTGEQKGNFISSAGGWFGMHYYEKIKAHTVGFPISAKFLWTPSTVYGLGLEVYANLNSLGSFYGINFCHQFGKLRPKKTKEI